MRWIGVSSHGGFVFRPLEEPRFAQGEHDEIARGAEIRVSLVRNARRSLDSTWNWFESVLSDSLEFQLSEKIAANFGHTHGICILPLCRPRSRNKGGFCENRRKSGLDGTWIWFESVPGDSLESELSRKIDMNLRHTHGIRIFPLFRPKSWNTGGFCGKG